MITWMACVSVTRHVRVVGDVEGEGEGSEGRLEIWDMRSCVSF